MTYLTETFAIIGKPLSRSFSSRLFNRYFSRNEIDAVYLPFEIDEDMLQYVKSAFRDTVIGFNVTSPFKEAAFRMCDDLDEVARSTLSVNLVTVHEGKFMGFNSDVYGFTYLMQKSGLSGFPERTVILGSGGASRSVRFSLQSLFPESRIEILGRGSGTSSDSITPYSLFRGTCNVIISTIPFQYQVEMMSTFSRVLRIGQPDLFVDLVYNPPVTPFIKEAVKAGMRSLNGLDMFLGQAVKAFQRWFDITPDPEDLRRLIGADKE